MSEPFVESIPAHLKSLVTRLDDYAKTQSEQTRRIEEDELFPALEEKDFRLKRVLARGGMGTVYIAEQISLERQVAVKVLDRSLVKNDTDRAQFEREAKLIAVLHHPGIVKILSAGEVNGLCFYAMELIDGPSLENVTLTSLRHLAMIGVKIANALAYAHQCHVLHRDIKPANIFLDSNDEIHLGDFGIAYSIHGHHIVFDAEGTPSGTPAYIAPERLTRGENTVRSDIYSFGITLRELAHASHLKLDHDFTAIVAKCVHIEPSQRYASIADVAKDLNDYLQYKPVQAANPKCIRRTQLWIRRNPIYSLLLGGFIIGISIWGIFAYRDYARFLADRQVLAQQQAAEQAELNRARADLAQLSIPEQHQYQEHEDFELRRTLDLAERILGRYPTDPEIVTKTLALYDDYINLHRHGKRNMLTALRETDRIMSTLGILFWNPKISDAIKEQLIEMQLRRLELSYRFIQTPEDSAWLKEKINIELNHYHGPQREIFLQRLNEVLTSPTPAFPSMPSPRHGGKRFERNNPQRKAASRFNDKHPRAPVNDTTTPPTQKNETIE